MTENSENPTWGDAPPPQADAPGPRWSGRKTIAAVAIAVGIAAAGGGVIYAASNSDAAQAGLGPRGGGYGRGGPGGMMMGGPGLMFGDTAHGEFQIGEVTEVASDSVTVKSTDGYSKTYKIDGDTKVNGGQGDVDDLAKGDSVTVVATADTADLILESGQFPGQRDGRGDGRGQGNGQQPPDGQRPPGDQGTPPTR
ncbi:hypothetical protein GCM10022243_56490 [Saccharothrix violaceirubra]|uniref:PPE-repeat protein n=1 Tax=Saccharothrix violaceirubra TaxID=413306 RepID=A0A7W7T5X2_9PSEU|nr:hypothetical protein [Saccharothrix violaceirubra]MBB4967161.1 PPE-repeat protein [Saccharothrix violaceirubra]